MSEYPSGMNDLKRRIGAFVVLVLGCTLLGGCTADPTDADIEYISLAQLRTIMEGRDADRLMLVDPRAKQDFDAGHIPGAQNHGINSERARTGGGLNPIFEGYKHLVVYGEDPASGPAKAMTKRLMYMKASNVKMFGGGMIEWRRAGLKVESSGGGAAQGAAGGATGGETTKQAGTLGK